MGPLDLPDLVRALVANVSQHVCDASNLTQPLGTPIEYISGRISICNIASLRQSNMLQASPDIAFLCLTPKDPNTLAGSTRDATEAPKMLSIQTPEGKKGQRHFLTAVLPRSMLFIEHHLQHGRAVCIACNTGTDISVGVAVAALALFFRPDGSWCSRRNACNDMCT